MSRLVVVRRHRQAVVGTVALRGPSELDGLGRRVGTSTRNHWYAAIHSTHHGCDYLFMFGVSQRGRFAGGAHRHNAVRPGLQVPVTKLSNAAQSMAPDAVIGVTKATKLPLKSFIACDMIPPER